MFSSAASNIIAHSVAVKCGFLAVLCPALNFPPSLFTNLAWIAKARAGVFMATDWIVAVLSYFEYSYYDYQLSKAGRKF